MKDNTMYIYTDEEVAAFKYNIKNDGDTTDNYGQIIIYTGVFEWSDGTLRNEAEPSASDEAECHCESEPIPCFECNNK